MEDPTLTNINPDDSIEETAEENGSGGLLDRIVEIRKEVIESSTTTLDLDVPGYQKLLIVRYRYIDGIVTEHMGKKLRKELKKIDGEGETLLGSVDTLIAACEQILVRDPGNENCLRDDKGKVTDLRPIQPGAIPPVQFDERLSEILKFDPPARSAREVVRGLFNNDHAIIRQNIALSQWLADTTKEVDQDFLGE